MKWPWSKPALRSTLARLAGVADPLAIDADGLRNLIDESLNFLRCGGVVSIAEWCEMSPAERAALVEASEMLIAAKASVFGMAGSSPAVAAAIGSRADGGEMSRGMAIQAVLSAVSRRESATDSSVPVGA